MNSHSILSFDIEIANIFDLKPGEDLDKYSPFDISVAAAVEDGCEPRLWHDTDDDGEPHGTCDRRLARSVLQHLRERQLDGVRVCAWNGLSFDLRWLGHVAQDPRLAAEVALDLYDPMFQFATRRGFPVGLAAVAEGLGVAQKKLMDGAQAPREWRDGNRRRVLDYVTGDCTLTSAVVRAIEKAGHVRWITKRGTPSIERIPELRRVRDVMNDPEPDQSWMSEPKPMTSYWTWMQEHAPTRSAR